MEMHQALIAYSTSLAESLDIMVQCAGAFGVPPGVIAARLGISQAYLSQMRRGKRDVTPKQTENLFQFFIGLYNTHPIKTAEQFWLVYKIIRAWQETHTMWHDMAFQAAAVTAEIVMRHSLRLAQGEQLNPEEWAAWKEGCKTLGAVPVKIECSEQILASWQGIEKALLSALREAVQNLIEQGQLTPQALDQMLSIGSQAYNPAEEEQTLQK